MRSVFAFALFLNALGGFAQDVTPVTEDKSDEKISFAVVENIPVAPGCEHLMEEEQTQQRECMNQYIIGHISENFSFPENARRKGVQAKIYVNFVIERDGSVSNIEVVRGAKDAYKDSGKKQRQGARDLDKEAVRVISTLKFVKPAFQRGKPVRMSFTIPINATLS